jgi:hypothetical protein
VFTRLRRRRQADPEGRVVGTIRDRILTPENVANAIDRAVEPPDFDAIAATAEARVRDFRLRVRWGTR